MGIIFHGGNFRGNVWQENAQGFVRGGISWAIFHGGMCGGVCFENCPGGCSDPCARLPVSTSSGNDLNHPG